MPPSKQAAAPSRSALLDDLIMGTNSSSITSKRSVERLYYPNEPHYFRFFVKKLQRRAPLINRGYWLRLRAIDVVIRQFLSRASTKKKVVINLGCGSDVIPWQCHARYPEFCENALFVDIDYPDLLRKKRTIVLETPQLRDLLGQDLVLSEAEKDPLLLKSDRYCQLACDLRELENLRQHLASLVPLADCEVLFVAEVSITYMDTKSADDLIDWAKSIGDAEFCLLEQIVPNGADHPFAETMLRHFDKLKTPPRSVKQYPTTGSQRDRFLARGWEHVDIWDLWDAWSGDTFVSAQERIGLDNVEPFDEWEEFILFGRHYFVLHALAKSRDEVAGSLEPSSRTFEAPPIRMSAVAHQLPKQTRRRFGNIVSLKNADNESYALHILGLGTDTRSDTCDIYSLGHKRCSLQPLQNGPPPRMCSAVTDLGEFGILVSGGRSSPAKAFADSWLFRLGRWETTWPVPRPVYRHAAVRLGSTGLALVTGGKSDSSQLCDDYYVFHPEKGWSTCNIVGPKPDATFGANLCCANDSDSPVGSFSGFLFGGLSNDGIISSSVLRWQLDVSGSEPNISFHNVTSTYEIGDYLSTFGAQVVQLGSHILICGGVGASHSHQGQLITFISVGSEKLEIVGCVSPSGPLNEWPFMIGSAVMSLGSSLFAVGGGATCFSMGTYWQEGFHRLELVDALTPEISPVMSVGEVTYVESPKLISHSGRNQLVTQHTTSEPHIMPIRRVQLADGESFERLLREGEPIVIQGLDFGTCVQNWEPPYMVNRVGKDKKVVVHECRADTDKMDFNSKNFQYVTDVFSDVLKRMQSGGRLYLRSLSYSQPTESPANLEEDFPDLAADFRLPEELQYVKDNLFSSVLRLSGRVNMWLHYDVMANIYTQISGSKRMVLFPPSDVSKLGFAPGASSSSLSIFSAQVPPQTHPCEAILNPGDALFLPSTWLHTATPLTDMSVAVNVFFRDLIEGYAKGKDVYGNRDLAAYERGRQEIEKLVKTFDKVPASVKGFYLRRLADELVEAAQEP